MATSNSWRGISCRSFVDQAPARAARPGRAWTMSDSASTGSPLIRMSSLTRSLGAVAGELVVERGVAARARLQLVVEVEDDLGERQPVVEHRRGRRREVLHARRTRRGGPVSSSMIAADVPRRARRCVASTNGSSIALDRRAVGQLRRVATICDRRRRAVLTLVRHAGRRGDELEVVLALEALLDDLHVEEAQEAAAEAEAERRRALRLEGERGVVERAASRARRAGPRSRRPRSGRGRRRPSA